MSTALPPLTESILRIEWDPEVSVARNFEEWVDALSDPTLFLADLPEVAAKLIVKVGPSAAFIVLDEVYWQNHQWRHLVLAYPDPEDDDEVTSGTVARAYARRDEASVVAEKLAGTY